MPYIPMPAGNIVIEIPDIIIGDTIIKRDATLCTMLYNANQKQVVLQWSVKHYGKNSDNSKGDYLAFIPDWTKQSLADNTTMCNLTTGVPVYEDYDTGQVNEHGEAVLDYDPGINYTGQFDFFFMLAENQDIRVNEMIMNFGRLVVSWEKPAFV